MHKATRRNTTLTMLDAIAPSRQRFTVLHNANPMPAKSATMRAIDRAVASLPPMHTDIPKEVPLPGVTEYGRIFDQPTYTAAYITRLNGRGK